MVSVFFGCGEETGFQGEVFWALRSVSSGVGSGVGGGSTGSGFLGGGGT